VLSVWEYIGSGYLKPRRRAPGGRRRGVDSCRPRSTARPAARTARRRGSRMKRSLPADCDGNADPQPELSDAVDGDFRRAATT
jgi:hypothetical protein